MCPNHDTGVRETKSVYVYVHKNSINMITCSHIIMVVELQKNQSPFTHIH